MMSHISIAEWDGNGKVLQASAIMSEAAAAAVCLIQISEGFSNAFVSDVPEGSASGWRVEGGAVVFKADIATATKNAVSMKALRFERNRRLAETDWWASSDVTMSDERKNYRAALRDLPANTSDPANPSWPTKP